MEKYFNAYPVTRAKFLQQILHSEFRIQKESIPQILIAGEVSHFEGVLALVLFVERLGDDGKLQPVALAFQSLQVGKSAIARGEDAASLRSLNGPSLVQNASD